MKGASQNSTDREPLRNSSGGVAINVGRFLPVLSLLGACLSVALTLTWYGSGLEGIDVATRSSARFSALVFAVALGTRLGPSGVAWMQAFVAAHLVHYATVAYEAVTNVHHRLHALDAWDGLVIISGVLPLLPLASAWFHRGTVWRRLNSIAVFLVGATFAGGAALNAPRYWTALIPVPLLLAGLTIHAYRSASQSQRTRLVLKRAG